MKVRADPNLSNVVFPLAPSFDATMKLFKIDGINLPHPVLTQFAATISWDTNSFLQVFPRMQAGEYFVVTQ